MLEDINGILRLVLCAIIVKVKTNSPHIYYIVGAPIPDHFSRHMYVMSLKIQKTPFFSPNFIY